MKRTVLVPVVTVLLLLGACSSSGDDANSGTTTSSSAATLSGRTGERVAVAIKTSGFEPRWAVVAVNGKVTFTNRTSVVQQIVFDNARDATGAALQSPPIEPGTTWVWTADSFASFAYHSPGLPGVDGRIQVDPPAEP